MKHENFQEILKILLKPYWNGIKNLVAFRQRNNNNIRLDEIDSQISVMVNEINSLEINGKKVSAEQLKFGSVKHIDRFLKTRKSHDYRKLAEEYIVDGRYVPQFLFAGGATRFGLGAMFDMDINAIGYVLLKGISDVHFKAGSPPFVRVNGGLVPIRFQNIDKEAVQEIAYSLMNAEQRKIFEEENELDIAYSIDEFSRFRVNINRQRGSIALTLRVVPLNVKSFEELNLPSETLRKLAAEQRGLILFAGITGAGKTTSMNSFIDYINTTYKKKIVTVEDPIEFYHKDKNSFIFQREVGQDTKSYQNALKYILRQGPDVIVIGEMRDFEAMSAGLTAAETGHLVLSTIHTSNAVQTIDRIINAYPPHQQALVRSQIANVLKGVIAQRLLVQKDNQSMVPATEVLIGTSHIRKQISENNIENIYRAMEQGGFYGMSTFDQDIFRLFSEGKITKEEGMSNCTNPDSIALKFQGFTQ